MLKRTKKLKKEKALQEDRERQLNETIERFERRFDVTAHMLPFEWSCTCLVCRADVVHAIAFVDILNKDMASQVEVPIPIRPFHGGVTWRENTGSAGRKDNCGFIIILRCRDGIFLYKHDKENARHIITRRASMPGQKPKLYVFIPSSLFNSIEEKESDGA